MDHSLLHKYNQPVPRYTSYPPANFFKDGFEHKNYEQLIVKSNSQAPENISFYVHIPFCKKMCFYCGCNKSPLAKEVEIKAYIDSLKKEIRMVSHLLDKNRKVSQIHFGGGTPNAIDSKYLLEINEIFYKNFEFIENPEIAIECNPAHLDTEYLNALVDAQFNRVSLGIQDFDHYVLKAVNRDASLLPVDEIIEFLKLKNPNITINLDFIYGLPLQTVISFEKTISKAIELRPDRLVTFSYAHVPWVNKAQKILEERGLPSNDDKIAMFQVASKILSESGYETIGMDHYALKEDELSQALNSKKLHRNFQGYCTKRTTGQVYAFGTSGISQLHSSYIQNTKSNQDYIKSLQSGSFACIKGYQLSDAEICIRAAINELMCNRQIVWFDVANELGLTSQELKHQLVYDEGKLEDLKNDGILEYDKDQIRVFDSHLIYIRNVAAALDPLMLKSQKSFSKPV